MVTGAGLKRLALVASPFLLLALGTGALLLSPWPAILGLMLRGRHVYVAGGWRTAALGVVGVASYVAALAISYTIRPARR